MTIPVVIQQAPPPAPNKGGRLGALDSQLSTLLSSFDDIQSISKGILSEYAHCSKHCSDIELPPQVAGRLENLDAKMTQVQRLHDEVHERRTITANHLQQQLAALRKVLAQEQRWIAQHKASAAQIAEETKHIQGVVHTAATLQAREQPATSLTVNLGEHHEHTFYTNLEGDVRGMFVATYSAFELGQRVTLEVVFPDGSRTQLAGMVGWMREHRDEAPHLSEGVGIVLDPSALDDPTFATQVEAVIQERGALFFPDI